MSTKKMVQKSDVRKLNQLNARITLLDKKRREALEQLVNQFCDLYGIAKSRRIDVMETEEKYRGAICAVLFAIDELSRRDIAVKRVYWDKYGGLLIELADQELNAVPIDQDIKRLVKQRKKQDCGWFIV
jgi:hypothetical protein